MIFSDNKIWTLLLVHFMTTIISLQIDEYFKRNMEIRANFITHSLIIFLLSSDLLKNVVIKRAIIATRQTINYRTVYV